MKVTIRKHPTDEDWMLCKEATLATVGKNPVSLPTMEWKKKILRARHSPIRMLEFVFSLEDIPSWVSVHLVRHVHATPFVRTQRNDRQSNYDRNKAPQDSPVSMRWLVNAEELQVIANKRLCTQAAKETRELVQMICDEVVKVNPEFDGLLVPMCEHCGGICYEFEPCGRCDSIRAKVIEIKKDTHTVCIEVPEISYANAGRILLTQENSNFGTLYYPDGGGDECGDNN